MKVIPTDVYEEGDLIRIEFHDMDGNFIVQSVWDENDPQDAKHREAFRQWSYRVVGQLDSGKYQVMT